MINRLRFFNKDFIFVFLFAVIYELKKIIFIMRSFYCLISVYSSSFLFSCNAGNINSDTAQTAFFDKSCMDTFEAVGNIFFEYTNGT